MKSILLLRHAKSSWGDPTLADMDRPLKKRGKKDARRIGALMRERKLRPDVVLCSPARRTRDTLELVLEKAKLETKPVFDERLYAASSAELLEIVRGLEEDADEVLIVGHNPGLEDLLALLTETAEAMPTAALARIALEVDGWAEVREKTGRVEWIARPKDLEG